MSFAAFEFVLSIFRPLLRVLFYQAKAGRQKQKNLERSHVIAVNYFGRFTSNIEREQPKRPIAISKASAQQWLDEQKRVL
jgi:hypothetical protein